MRLIIMKRIYLRLVAEYERHEPWFAYGTMLILGFISYTPLLHKLGFYRDDWYILWAGHALGPQSIIDLFAFDRPLVGYLNAGSYRLLGEDPLSWQLYSFCIRTIGALAFLWLVRRLWPRHNIETSTAAIVMFLYPGFLQWANANTYSNHITTYTLGVLSICLTAASLQATKKGLKILFSVIAIISAVGYWFLFEFMIGLEGLRLLIIGMYAWRGESRPHQGTFLQLLRDWSPYLVLILLHLAWRLFVFESGRVGMNVDYVFSAYDSDPIKVILKRLLFLGIDFYETTISAWAVPINSVTFQQGPKVLAMAGFLCLVGVAVYVAYFYITAAQPPRSPLPQNECRDYLEMFIVGGVSILSALLPVVAVGRDVRWDSGYDRYTLQASAGVAVFLVGTISGLVRSRHKVTLYALLIGIAIATHYGNAVHWADFWEDQRDLWWQLSWRAPQLEDGTVLLVEMPEEGFYEDYEIWGPANLVYDPDGDSVRIRSEIFTPETLEKIRVGVTETRDVRNVFEFQRDFFHSLILTRPARSSCWHVIDGDDPVFPQITSGMLYTTRRISNMDQIIVNSPPSLPPSLIFGVEPEHRWCYFFQKASLEAQRGNWASVAQFYDHALDMDFKPIDRSEWMPFLKGLVMEDRNEDAERTALWIRDVEVVRHRQCDYLSDTALPDHGHQAYLKEILCE